MTELLELFKRYARRAGVLVTIRLLLAFSAASPAFAAQPAISSVARGDEALIITATVPAGYRHALLETGGNLYEPLQEPLISGPLDGNSAEITFLVPNADDIQFFRVRVGPEAAIPPATYSGPSYFLVNYTGGPSALTDAQKAGHILSRLAYGPAPSEITSLEALGLTGYIEQQLNPTSLDESTHLPLVEREAALFRLYQPGEDIPLVQQGEIWSYFKGTQAPPATWASPDFDDSSWLQGPTGIGYGDDDDATLLDDMRQTDTTPGYLTFYARRTFSVDSLENIDALLLSIDFDDGFVAYLNGTEIARENVSGSSPGFADPASGSRDAGSVAVFDLTTRTYLLRLGANTLAIELHNVNRTSSDATLIPELLARRFLPVPSQLRIRDIESLQELIHVRGIYSRRQLQAVLGEFWENHFTTDYDKVAEFFEDLRNSDARPAMGEDQVAAEAAQAEYREYQFFYDHALGNFGDLLLYSATSPAQLIYLDNVLNVKGAANENYAREILELFAFGVDNRYTQQDIEELARCFTGWGVRKVASDQAQSFPDSARNPPTEPGVRFNDTVLLEAGPGWKLFKGTTEPSPVASAPTIAWAQPDFDDAAWLNAVTGIGYGDGDDATILSDMRTRYLSIYARREFLLTDPAALENLLLEVDYDDGFVAYINGVEVARSRTMLELGTPAFNTPARGNHEAGDPETFSLAGYLHLLKPAPEVNVLAIQAHNVDLTSSDFSLIPRLIERALQPGSIENGDPNGVWTFRFNPEEHDTGAKVLFADTPHEINVPAGRTGLAGLLDAVEIIDSFVDHPSVSEFICLKLINKFVSDEISLSSYHDRTAPPGLLTLMDDAIAAWHSTSPAGNIKTVMETILTPHDYSSFFWSRDAYRTKIKTAVEFINSTARALQVDVAGTELPEVNEALGMTLFTRDDPDGWSELGTDWIDTGTMLARIKFAQSLTLNRLSEVDWDVDAWLTEHQLSSTESIIDYLDELLFRGELPAASRELLITFANTDVNGAPLPLDPSRTDYLGRVRELVSLILSAPQWHYQ